eukprot:Rmarinus@m.16355
MRCFLNRNRLLVQIWTYLRGRIGGEENGWSDASCGRSKSRINTSLKLINRMNSWKRRKRRRRKHVLLEKNREGRKTRRNRRRRTAKSMRSVSKAFLPTAVFTPNSVDFPMRLYLQNPLWNHR